MAKQTVPFYHCNGGEVSHLALMRVDIDKMRLAADTMVNWMPLTQGPMTLRPGSQYLGTTKDNQPCRLLEFVYASDDAALVEVTDGYIRIWQNDALVTRESVTSTIQSYASWTKTASTGSTITVDGSGNLVFNAVTEGNRSYAYGTIDCTSNLNKKHGLKFQVLQGGDLLFKMGTSLGDDDIIATTTLGTGYHSIGFVPTINTLYIQLESQDEQSYTVGAMSFETAGPLAIVAPWATADLPNIRYDQSADVIFVACEGKQQRMIERRSGNSWSVVLYETKDGPFPAKAGDTTYKFTTSDTRGDVTITCNKAFFRSTYEGALIRLFHEGQNFTQRLNVQGVATDSIRVSGVANYVTTILNSTATTPPVYWYVNPVTGAILDASLFPPPPGYNLSHDREFTITITGLTGTGSTIELQRTYDPDGLSDWTTVESYTSNVSKTYTGDTADNVIVYYRLFCRTYSTGTASCTLAYTGSGGYGVARIKTVSSTTSASCQVIHPFVNTVQTSNWRLSQWNGEDGYPSSVTIHEGRMWWSGGSRIWGSVSDDYTSFDFEATGDAAPISRSIGKGPIQNTRFMMSLGRLVVGTDSGIVTARSSSFDEPLTPKNFILKYTNTQGVSALRGVQLDTKGIFVQRSDRRVYMIDFTAQKFDYQTLDLTRLNTDIGFPGFADMAIQRQFDTRLWFVRDDGMMAVLVYDEQDEVVAWYRLEAADEGAYENVAVLPGTLEDAVYTVVNRDNVRLIEKFARLDQATDGPDNRLSDSFVYAGTTDTVTGLAHLEGRTVCVWGSSLDLGTFTVSSGQISLGTIYTDVVVGLPYKARYVSAKLAYAAQGGTAVNQAKRAAQVGFVLSKTHYQGVKYGQYNTETNQYTADNLPLVEEGKTTASSKIWTHYDQQDFDMNGLWTADSRIYIEANSPRPATVLGFTIDMATSG